MRQYPQLFSQRDSRWSGILINNIPGATLGLYGCLIISWEMKANYYGHLLTPPQLLNLLMQQKLFVDGDLISNDNDLDIVFADINYMQTLHYENTPADLDALCRLSDDESNTGTLELDFDHNPNDGIQTHFVELHTCVKRSDGTYEVRIYDPWDGREKDFSETYGSDPTTTIQKVIVYKGAPASQTSTASNNTVPVDVTAFARMRTKSDNVEAIGAYFHLSNDEMVQADAGQKVVELIKAKDDEIGQLQDQLRTQPHPDALPPPDITSTQQSGMQAPLAHGNITSVPPLPTQLQGSDGLSHQTVTSSSQMVGPLGFWSKAWRVLVLLNPLD